MTRTIYKYRFAKHVPMKDVEDALDLAALAAESLHGGVEFRMNAHMRLDKREHICTIDAGSPVGLHIAKIFTGFLIAAFGNMAFETMVTEEQRRFATSVCLLWVML